MKKIYYFTFLLLVFSLMMFIVLLISKLLASAFFYITKGIFYFDYENLAEYMAIAICAGFFLSAASCLVQYFQHKKNR